MTTTMDAPLALRDFSPYGQLVAALLPRAAGLSIFEPDGQLRWTSDDTDDPLLPPLVEQSATLAALHTAPGERLQIRHDEPVYLFWLRDAERRLTAVLCVRWRLAQSDPRTFAYVHAMLRPVIECLARELHLQARLEAGGAAGSVPDAKPEAGD